ncbi:uncharacterized protein LOC134209829 [Armigeres subalbatus]|uniref:uncharacterized protein LOC134209829 n=1 Tax=Armigeres subalbatus TaxID=124917 RepID=UPI002ED2E6E1
MFPEYRKLRRFRPTHMCRVMRSAYPAIHPQCRDQASTESESNSNGSRTSISVANTHFGYTPIDTGSGYRWIYQQRAQPINRSAGCSSTEPGMSLFVPRCRYRRVPQTIVASTVSSFRMVHNYDANYKGTVSRAIKTKKAPGLDRIRNVLLKHFPRKGLILLTKILNACLKLCYFPVKWKHASLRDCGFDKYSKDIPDILEEIVLIDVIVERYNFTGTPKKKSSKKDQSLADIEVLGTSMESVRLPRKGTEGQHPQR